MMKKNESKTMNPKTGFPISKQTFPFEFVIAIIMLFLNVLKQKIDCPKTPLKKSVQIYVFPRKIIQNSTFFRFFYFQFAKYCKKHPKPTQFTYIYTFLYQIIQKYELYKKNICVIFYFL